MRTLLLALTRTTLFAFVIPFTWFAVCAFQFTHANNPITTAMSATGAALCIWLCVYTIRNRRAFLTVAVALTLALASSHAQACEQPAAGSHLVIREFQASWHALRATRLEAKLQKQLNWRPKSAR